jgi:hypothetical protein
MIPVRNAFKVARGYDSRGYFPSAQGQYRMPLHGHDWFYRVWIGCTAGFYRANAELSYRTTHALVRSSIQTPGSILTMMKIGTYTLIHGCDLSRMRELHVHTPIAVRHCCSGWQRVGHGIHRHRPRATITDFGQFI